MSKEVDVEQVRSAVRDWLKRMPYLKSYIDPARITVADDLVRVLIQVPQEGGRLHAMSLIDLAVKLEEWYPCTVELRVTVERPSGEPDFAWPRDD